MLELDFWGRPFSIDFKEGAWSVIVGKTGHGKTHLLEQIAEYVKTGRNDMSLVLQDPYLFNDNIEQNIFLGRDYTVEEKQQALKLLRLFGLDELTSQSKDLLSLEVGEHGKTLSGGQAKRLCLVRSLMSDAKVYLWDDPFSSVDVVVERNIMRELKTILNEKTLIMTSHRITTVKNSDDVIYIDKERGLVESGNQVKLLEEGTELYEYFRAQMV